VHSLIPSTKKGTDCLNNSMVFSVNPSLSREDKDFVAQGHKFISFFYSSKTGIFVGILQKKGLHPVFYK